MRKKILLIAIPVVLLLVLSAQITQKQADAIIMERMSEKTQPHTIFSKNGVQEKTTITFADGEIFDLEYPCFVYYIRYEEKMNDKFLIVNENNGNLLEIRTQANAEPYNLAEWRIVEERCFCVMDTLRGEWTWTKINLGGWVEEVTFDNEFKSVLKILNQNEDGSINYEVVIEDTLFYEGSFHIQQNHWHRREVEIKLPFRWFYNQYHFINNWTLDFLDYPTWQPSKNTLIFRPAIGRFPSFLIYERIK